MLLFFAGVNVLNAAGRQIGLRESADPGTCGWKRLAVSRLFNRQDEQMLKKKPNKKNPPNHFKLGRAIKKS